MKVDSIPFAKISWIPVNSLLSTPFELTAINFGLLLKSYSSRSFSLGHLKLTYFGLIGFPIRGIYFKLTSTDGGASWHISLLISY